MIFSTGSTVKSNLCWRLAVFRDHVPRDHLSQYEKWVSLYIDSQLTDWWSSNMDRNWRRGEGVILKGYREARVCLFSRNNSFHNRYSWNWRTLWAGWEVASVHDVTTSAYHSIIRELFTVPRADETTELHVIVIFWIPVNISHCLELMPVFPLKPHTEYSETSL